MEIVKDEDLFLIMVIEQTESAQYKIVWVWSIVAFRGGIKKKLFFFGVYPKGGGGLAESKISLSENDRNFLDFFAERGGVLTQSKISVIRNCLFFLEMGGGSFTIQNFLIRKTEIFVGFFLPKRGGVLTYSKRVFII